jgi:hypothetical protein
MVESIAVPVPDAPAAETSADERPFNISWRLSLACLAGGAGLGEVIVWIERAGVQTRPLVGIALLLAGVAAAIVPLRYGLFFVIVCCAFQGFLIDFIGTPGLYWKEAFVAALVARALRRRLPTLAELGTFLIVGGIMLAYVVLNHSVTEVSWGAKILLLFVLAAWAVRAFDFGPREWVASFAALMVVVAASFVLAQWQRHEGVYGLLNLGFTYGGPVRQVGNDLRVFAGFIYGAPFAYTMALAALCWFALLLSGYTQAALRTLWVPGAASIGIVWSLSRIALVGLVIACAVVTLRQRRIHVVAPAALIFAGLIIFASGSSLGFLGQGFTFSSQSAKDRTALWKERWSEVGVFGGGPGSAGAAFARAADTAGGNASTSEGVTDNLYVSWLLQYGVVLGIPLALIWLYVLGRPVFFSRAGPAELTGALFGVFAIISALAVNIWEEFPVNLVIALFIAQAYGPAPPTELPERSPDAGYERSPRAVARHA